MLFIEENCLSDSAVDGQRIKVETQLLSYQKLHIIPSACMNTVNMIYEIHIYIIILTYFKPGNYWMINIC